GKTSICAAEKIAMVDSLQLLFACPLRNDKGIHVGLECGSNLFDKRKTRIHPSELLKLNAGIKNVKGTMKKVDILLVRILYFPGYVFTWAVFRSTKPIVAFELNLRPFTMHQRPVQKQVVVDRVDVLKMT